ncbi:hypothetical protein L1887_36342 [Cichorium endivia]|nr:hypothetical protein L1887_36342 [Cichorium endivia]
MKSRRSGTCTYEPIPLAGVALMAGVPEWLCVNPSGLVLEEHSTFSVKEVGRSVSTAVGVENGGSAEAKAAAYWTTLTPNVDDYSGPTEVLVKMMVDKDIEVVTREKVIVDDGYMDVQQQP